MAIYKVAEKGVDKIRAVEAKSADAAVKHVTHDRFSVELVQGSAAAFALAAAGVTVEKAGEHPAPPAVDNGGE